MIMKRCSSCKEDKELDKFYKELKRSDGLGSRCKECVKKLSLNYYHNNKTDPEFKRKKQERKNKCRSRKRDLILPLKAKPCADCGFKGHPWQMDFDHIDPANKLGDISDYNNSDYSYKTLLDEIAKCEVVCANCHRLREYHRAVSSGRSKPIESFT